MKCKCLESSGINLVKVEQSRLPVTIAERTSDGTYSYSNVNPSGKKHNIVDKKTNPKCACSAEGKSGFVCPKIGSVKEGGLRKEHGSVWRVTPICSTIQKL